MWNDFGFADRMASSVRSSLWNYLAIFQRKKLHRRFDTSPCRESGVEKIQHLGAEDREVAADEDEHLPRRDDLLGVPVAHFLGRLQAQHLVGRHQRALN